MKEYLYIDDQGQQIGPISEHELKYLKASGIINNETYVWTEGMTDWLPFDKAFPEAAGGSVPQNPPTVPPAPVMSEASAKSPKISLKSPSGILKNKRALCGISLAALACVAIIGVSISSFSDGDMSAAAAEKKKVAERIAKKITQEEAFEELRKYGIVNSLLDIEGEVGQRALVAAAKQGNFKIVHYLVAGGTPVNASVRVDRSDYERTALYYASKGGYSDIVALLLQTPGIDVNEDFPLAVAAKNGHKEIVRMLLAVSDIDVNTSDPLEAAAENGHTEVVKLLLAAPGIDVNKSVPLRAAARAGHTEVVRLLLSAGADVNRENQYGHTPLSEAVSGGHTEVVRLLLSAGADVNREDIYGNTLLREAAREGHTEIVELLQAAGARK